MGDIDQSRVDKIRDKIMWVALLEYLAYRFDPPDNKAGPTNPRIAAKLWEDDNTKKRQGWKHLKEIYTNAGVQLKETIDKDIRDKYKNGSITTEERNKRDMGSWCGLFALHCYKLAGLNMQAWPLKTAPAFTDPKGMDLIVDPKPEKGDIGRIPMPSNHHFIVIKVEGSTVHSIDGNDEPHSQITYRTRTLSDLKTKKAEFYCPNWQKHL